MGTRLDPNRIQLGRNTFYVIDDRGGHFAFSSPEADAPSRVTLSAIPLQLEARPSVEMLRRFLRRVTVMFIGAWLLVACILVLLAADL